MPSPFPQFATPLHLNQIPKDDKEARHHLYKLCLKRNLRAYGGEYDAVIPERKRPDRIAESLVVSTRQP